MADSLAFMLRFEEPRIITPAADTVFHGAAVEPKAHQRCSVPPPGTMTVTETTAETTDSDADDHSYYTIPLRGST
jgi:hypothetical protein